MIDKGRGAHLIVNSSKLARVTRRLPAAVRAAPSVIVSDVTAVPAGSSP